MLQMWAWCHSHSQGVISGQAPGGKLSDEDVDDCVADESEYMESIAMKAMIPTERM